MGGLSRVTGGGMHASGDRNNHDDQATVERRRLAKALETGLEDTFRRLILLLIFRDQDGAPEHLGTNL
jgi:hypothetical protein